MGITNIGNQVISYDFKEAIISRGFNKLNYNLHPKGIYSGGEFTRVSDTELSIAPLLCVFYDDTKETATRIETQDIATIDIDPTKPFVILRFQWLDTENNYMDIISSDEISIAPSDFILGRVQYNGLVLTETFDYSRKSWVNSKYFHFYDNKPPFKVEPTFPLSNSIKVSPSNGKFIHNGKVIELLTETVSPSFEFPVSANGRKDVVAFNSDTNTIQVIKGTDAVGAPLPLISHNMLPIAIITLPPSTLSTVRGDYITFINPYYYKGSNISDLEIFNRLKTVSGEVGGLDGDTLGGSHASYYTDKLVEIAGYMDIPIPLV